MSNWKAGDRGVCISHFETLPNDVSECPKIGVTYLIHGVAMGSDILGLQIAGLPTGDNPFGWWAARFRKVVPACDSVENEENLDIKITIDTKGLLEELERLANDSSDREGEEWKK